MPGRITLRKRLEENPVKLLRRLWHAALCALGPQENAGWGREHCRRCGNIRDRSWAPRREEESGKKRTCCIHRGRPGRRGWRAGVPWEQRDHLNSSLPNRMAERERQCQEGEALLAAAELAVVPLYRVRAVGLAHPLLAGDARPGQGPCWGRVRGPGRVCGSRPEAAGPHARRRGPADPGQPGRPTPVRGNQEYTWRRGHEGDWETSPFPGAGRPPPERYGRLTEGVVWCKSWRNHPTRGEALAGLSDACLSYAGEKEVREYVVGTDSRRPFPVGLRRRVGRRSPPGGPWDEAGRPAPPARTAQAPQGSGCSGLARPTRLIFCRRKLAEGVK
jgi:hypothetical protein